MNQKALNALEYPKIIEKLTDKASSYRVHIPLLSTYRKSVFLYGKTAL